MRHLIIVLMIVFSISLAGGLCKTLTTLNDVIDEVTVYNENEWPTGRENFSITPMTTVPIY